MNSPATNSPAANGAAAAGAEAAGGTAEATPLTSVDDVREFAELTCLIDGPTPSGRIGIETEWFVVDLRDPTAPVRPERSRAAMGDAELPGGSRLTFEPGGQLELSGPPRPLAEALPAMASDLAAARERLAEDDLVLAGLGADPLRPPVRVLTEDRYAAMASYFAGAGFPAGKLMMCSTAALQVNLDAGPRAGWGDRWRLAHALGPVLLAMFAASPVLAGRSTGQVSTRQMIWAGIDRTRTSPVAASAPAAAPAPAAARAGRLPARRQPARRLPARQLPASLADRFDPAEPAEQWASYLLAARLMLVPGEDGEGQPVLDGSTFADWLAGNGPSRRRPTVDDLAYHATTLFPPVRPRGWLELRYLDAQSAAAWPLAATATTALLDDPVAADIAARACAPVADRWDDAAVRGLADPDLRRAALTCVLAAVDAAPRIGADAGVVAALAEFAETSVRIGRCPADGLLAAWRDTGGEGLLLEVAGAASPCVPAR